jgi:uncharacterized protein (DUF433 family)
METKTEVIRDPAIMGGEPTVSGTRILAGTILSYLRAGSSAEEIFRDYPSLPVDGIDAVARWAEDIYGAGWRFREMLPLSLENYELQRDPDETDEEYASRRSLFDDSGCYDRRMTQQPQEYSIASRPVAVTFSDHEIAVTLADGRRIVTPLYWYPRLRDATPGQREVYELMPLGIHWPELDEDLSVAGMLEGRRPTPRP